MGLAKGNNQIDIEVSLSRAYRDAAVYVYIDLAKYLIDLRASHSFGRPIDNCGACVYYEAAYE